MCKLNNYLGKRKFPHDIRYTFVKCHVLPTVTHSLKFLVST